ncbi:pyrroline-5-carboxylate reductase 2 [Anaeramoeba ignava]|uniref:Pyrroline-5-carboxylate reductase n=1 Tax=Anaeramoeba ignava TaxID=1746090 RepID=A0A9Q0L9D9_ANAIG|nr:pyrroline-5-carboxylate reductase 2 [Anaeramoeba ignava]
MSLYKKIGFGVTAAAIVGAAIYGGYKVSQHYGYFQKKQTIKQKIGFIGSGMMAEAIARGILEKELVKPDQVMGSDPIPERREVFKKYGFHATENNEEVVEFADIIILATKPQVAEEMLKHLKNKNLAEEKIVVTIMAGKQIGWVKEHLGEKSKIVRVMPNTPLAIGEGAAGIVSKGCSKEEVDLVVSIFKSVAVVEVFEDESKIDIVTGLSGSGPAYIFRLIEAMVEGGVQGGLNENDALELAIQTVIGAGKLAAKRRAENISIPKLREMVTSPHGTTEAGLNFLDKNHFYETVSGAVVKATERSIELGKN